MLPNTKLENTALTKLLQRQGISVWKFLKTNQNALLCSYKGTHRINVFCTSVCVCVYRTMLPCQRIVAILAYVIYVTVSTSNLQYFILHCLLLYSLKFYMLASLLEWANNISLPPLPCIPHITYISGTIRIGVVQRIASQEPA